MLRIALSNFNEGEDITMSIKLTMMASYCVEALAEASLRVKGSEPLNLQCMLSSEPMSHITLAEGNVDFAGYR